MKRLPLMANDIEQLVHDHLYFIRVSPSLRAIPDKGFVYFEVVFGQGFLIAFQSLRSDILMGGVTDEGDPPAMVPQEMVGAFIAAKSVIY